MTTYVSQSQNTNAIAVYIMYDFGVKNGGRIKCQFSDVKHIVPAIIKNKNSGRVPNFMISKFRNGYEIIMENREFNKRNQTPGYQHFEYVQPCYDEPDYEIIVFIQEKVGRADVSDDCWDIIRTQDVYVQ